MWIFSEEVLFADTGPDIEVRIDKREWQFDQFVFKTGYAHEGRLEYACSRAHLAALRGMKHIHMVDAVWKLFGKNRNASMVKAMPASLSSLAFETMTTEECQEAMEWFESNNIERILDRESKHP
jgi:hypothetical protein